MVQIFVVNVDKLDEIHKKTPNKTSSCRICISYKYLSVLVKIWCAFFGNNASTLPFWTIVSNVYVLL